MRSLLTERSANAELIVGEHRGRGGAIFGAREDFLAFVESRVLRAGSVHLVCGCSDERDWISWRLSPRPFTDRPQDADWIVYHRADPPAESGRHLRAADALRTAVRAGPGAPVRQLVGPVALHGGFLLAG